MKRVSSTRAKNLVFEGCVKAIKAIAEPDKELFYSRVQFVKSFCCLWDSLFESGGSEAVVSVRTRAGWIELRERGKLLHGRKLL